MTLTAADELRHQHLVNDDPYWRESIYFNFNDADNEIGGWIYLWVVPNQDKPSGMLVSLYHGEWPDLEINDKAMNAAGHRVAEGERWLYCYKKDVDFLIAHDFDDVELAGLSLRRTRPLKGYELKFSDSGGNRFDLSCEFSMPPYDYADGVYPTPSWMAANRYHRAWRVGGEISVAGRNFRIDCTGDSDHSWGQRHVQEFAKNVFKMWSFQSADGSLAVSVLKQGVGSEEIPLGYVMIDGRVASAKRIDTEARFDENGVQSHIDLAIEDELGRSVSAHMPRMHSYLGSGSRAHFWGFEGVGDYTVEGVGQVRGLSSYFWPAQVTPEGLRSGKWK